MPACTGQPVSWLRLERYAAGELPAPDRDAIAEHVDACDACARALGHIRADDHPLPPLTATVPAARARRWWPWAAAATAAAAVALAIAVTRPPRGDTAAVPAPRVAIKGGELAIELVRERAGSIAYDPTEFTAGDRFKVLVTCPPNGPTFADVVIYQDGAAFFPLDPADLRCGNRVAVPGAFRLTGDTPALICVTLSADAPADRATLAQAPGSLPATACLPLGAGSPR